MSRTSAGLTPHTVLSVLSAALPAWILSTLRRVPVLLAPFLFTRILFLSALLLTALLLPVAALLAGLAWHLTALRFATLILVHVASLADVGRRGWEQIRCRINTNLSDPYLIRSH
jgi:hypothetical protein